MAKNARERLLLSTIELIRTRGVAGTGINDVIAHSGAARRSIYLNFPGGKDELVAEAASYAGRFITTVMDAATAGTDDPVVALERFVAMWRLSLIKGDFRAGCPVAVSAMAAEAAPSAVAQAAAAFAHWEERVAAGLTSAGVASKTAASLAVMTVAAIEGALILSICARDPGPIEAAGRHLRELFQLHLPNRADA